MSDWPDTDRPPAVDSELDRRWTLPSASHAVLPAAGAWKRVLDLTLGSLALILCAPIMIVALFLVLTSGAGPIIFRQTRIGKDERPFTVLKFRTMRLGQPDLAADREIYLSELEGDAPPNRRALFKRDDDPRLTAVGRFMRSFSIDELPQLVNVLRGEMSLVGPRPALPWEVELFTPRQRRRHRERPGMTGLWQVSGRNRLNSAEMLSLDVVYVENCSLRLDLIILLRTPMAVLFHRHTR